MSRFIVTKNSWIPKLAERVAAAGVAGVDIEAYSDPKYSLDPTEFGLDPWRNKIRSVQIAVEGYTWFVDLKYVTEVEPLKRVLADRSIIKIVHNAQYETMNFIRHWDGCFPDGVWDTMLVSQLYGRAMAHDRHGLGFVAERFCGIELNKEEQLSNWRDDLSESQYDYAFNDAEVLLPIYREQRKRIERDGMLRCAIIECDAVLGFADMGLGGVPADLEVVDKITDVIGGRISKLRRSLSEFFPSPALSLFEAECGPASINFDSPAQLLDALQGMNINPMEKDKKSGIVKPSTSKGALLKERTKKNAPIIDALLDYSSLTQMFSTYCEPMRDYIHPVTGRIHGSFRQLGQSQHRPTVTKPNLLNQPRPNKFGPGVPDSMKEWFHCDLSFRHAYVPDSGCLFSIADFANNQARVVADRAQVKSLIEEFNLPKADPYKRIAAAVLGIPKEEVTGPQRQDAKVWVLAFLFGAGWKRYQQAVLELARLTITDAKARNDRTAFFRGLPELETWHEDEPEFVQENGYVMTPYGRRIFFDMTRRNADGTLKVPRNDAINYPICGTEVDGAKDAIGRIARMIRSERIDPIKNGIKLFVYDEIVAQVPERQAEDFFPKQQRIMTEAMQGVLATVPAKVDGGVGINWAAK